MNKIDVISSVIAALQANDTGSAQQILAQAYPFRPAEKAARRYTIDEMTAQFFRDGFIDRYTGERLLHPGLLRVLSAKMPEEFPYHPHWKTSECHMAYWELQPTIDHMVPVVVGGADSWENWVTTSMKNNALKSAFTLEQLGWTLHPAGTLSEWDGLTGCFVKMAEADGMLLQNGRIRAWYRAAKKYLHLYKMDV